MNDRNNRSAAEVMANAARVVKAAVNIVRAAIAGGLHGAAAAAAKELLPTIIKFAVGVLIAIIVIPMFVISAMPNNGWLQRPVCDPFSMKPEKFFLRFRQHQADMADILRAAAGHHVDG